MRSGVNGKVVGEVGLIISGPYPTLGKRKDKPRSCQKCKYLERGTNVPEGGIRQRRG